MKTKPKSLTPARLLQSPLIFLLFLIIPLVVVLLRIGGRNAHTLDLLLANNALLLVYVGARLRLLLKNRSGSLRYGAVPYFPRRSTQAAIPVASLREQLQREGFQFDAAGSYAEQRDRGYAGSLLAHGALAVLLAFGLYDNLRQLDGTVLLGVGEPLKLYEKRSYGVLVEGPLASVAQAELKLQIKRQILPCREWPAGATEVVLWSPQDKELQRGLIAPGAPMRHGEVDIHMNRLLYDAWVVVTTSKNLIVFTNFVKLLPKAGEPGGYSHYGEFGDPFLKVAGSLWLDPERKALKVATTRQGEKIGDTELLLWGGNKKEQGGYVAKFEGLGQWSELHVTRHRHKGALAVGGGLVLLGLLLRLVWWPKRVWIEEEGSGSLVSSTNGKLLARIREMSR